MRGTTNQVANWHVITFVRRLLHGAFVSVVARKMSRKCQPSVCKSRLISGDQRTFRRVDLSGAMKIRFGEGQAKGNSKLLGRAAYISNILAAFSKPHICPYHAPKHFGPDDFFGQRDLSDPNGLLTQYRMPAAGPQSAWQNYYRCLHGLHDIPSTGPFGYPTPLVC